MLFMSEVSKVHTGSRQHRFHVSCPSPHLAARSPTAVSLEVWRQMTMTTMTDEQQQTIDDCMYALHEMREKNKQGFAPSFVVWVLMFVAVRIEGFL